MSPVGAVSLMWEPWEARADDIDYRAARELGIPVVGTRETHPEVRTFDYLGLLAAKLLFEARCPILGSIVGVIGSDPFGSFVRKSLASLGDRGWRACARRGDIGNHVKYEAPQYAMHQGRQVEAEQMLRPQPHDPERSKS